MLRISHFFYVFHSTLSPCSIFRTGARHTTKCANDSHRYIDLYDPTIIAIADIQDYLDYKWTLPTIVLAFENEGTA